MLKIEGLAAKYDDVVAIKQLDLEMDQGEIVCLLGPSGCGKSTLLRVVAGLEKPSSGTIWWDGVDLSKVPVHRRGFGLMFQDYALFPHRTVASNIAFGLQMKKASQAEQDERVEEVLELVGLPGYGDRTIGQMSGGQQQRVALARAIAPSPSLLMFDEPLGALDRSLRERLVLELGGILRGLGTASLYVTHDQEEAFALADRVLLMNHGEVEQVGTPQELWSRPRTPFAAHFLGFRNLFECTEAAAAGWPIPQEAAQHVVYRADGFSIDVDGQFVGTVENRTYRGDHVLIRIASPSGLDLEVEVRWGVEPSLGENLRLKIDPSSIVPVEG